MGYRSLGYDVRGDMENRSLIGENDGDMSSFTNAGSAGSCSTTTNRNQYQKYQRVHREVRSRTAHDGRVP